ncbi:MAG: hypothetical protein WDO24_06935 [Pseudomonadota bacterium]
MRQLTQTLSAEMRTKLTHFERSYGPTADETLEILPTERQGAPVVLHVHGGPLAAPAA